MIFVTINVLCDLAIGRYTVFVTYIIVCIQFYFFKFLPINDFIHSCNVMQSNFLKWPVS